MVDEVISICITILIFGAAVFFMLQAIGKDLPMFTLGQAALGSLDSIILAIAVYGLWRAEPAPTSLIYCGVIWAILLGNIATFWLRIGGSRSQLTRAQAGIVIVLWAVSISAAIGIMTG